MPIYMKIDTIPGESTDPGYEGWHIVSSFSWGETAVAPTSGGGGTGKAQINDLRVSKATGKGSPALMLTCATGRHLPAVQLVTTTSVNNADMPLERFTLTTVLVTGFQIDGDAASRAAEMVTFNFGSLKFDLFINRTDGSHATETATIQG